MSNGEKLPRTIGPYEVLAPLGAGGMGAVYLAASPTASRVAVKVVLGALAGDSRMRDRFMGEVDTLRMTFGSRVARFEGADLHADPPWLAIEYKPGVTLRDHVTRHGPLPAELGLILGALLAEGIGSIHTAGLVHRDIKPNNVIMSDDGPVIIDFGLAMLAEGHEHVTQTGSAVGTPAYMAPEQARGERDLTGATDIYALGSSLVMALTGHTIYPSATPFAVAQHVMDPNRHPDLSGLPSEITGVVGPMLAHDPHLRPSAEQVLEALLRVMRRDGLDPGDLRRRLRDLTFVVPTLVLPSWADDPVVDPEEIDSAEIDTGPTVPLGDKPSAAPEPTTRADVTKLLSEIRTRYAAGGSL